MTKSRYPGLKKYATLRSKMMKFRQEEKLVWGEVLQQVHGAKPKRKTRYAM